MQRIHLLGASGSGTSTLGAALAARRGIAWHDSDDFLWMPTDPPYTTLRPVPERSARLLAALGAQQSWVLSGSALGWGACAAPLYTLIVFLQLDPELRMARLRRREAQRYGARIAPGGDMAAASAAFLAWAEAYDSAGPEQRSLCAHEAWLAQQTAPVLRLESSAPLPDLLEAVQRALS